MTTALAPTPPRPVPTVAAVHEATIGPEPRDDVTDGDLAHAIVFGLTVGTVAVFVVTLGIALTVGVSFGEALLIAALPAVFGGIYFGGAPVLLTRLLRFEAQERRQRAGHLSDPTTGR
jgi:hypothetical protein